MECDRNPRTCHSAPDNQLVHEIRNTLLRWPAQRRALVKAVQNLCAFKVDDKSRELLSALNDIQCTLKSIEASLALYAGKENDTNG